MTSWQPLAVFTEHTGMVARVAWNRDGTRLASTSCGVKGLDNACLQGEIIITDYDLASRNCGAARRNFSWDEWQRVFPDEPYRVICSQWPAHPSVPAEALPEG